MTSPMRINFSVARLRLAWLFVGRTITAQRQAPDGSPAREELETGFLGAPELQRWNKERRRAQFLPPDHFHSSIRYFLGTRSELDTRAAICHCSREKVLLERSSVINKPACGPCLGDFLENLLKTTASEKCPHVQLRLQLCRPRTHGLEGGRPEALGPWA